MSNVALRQQGAVVEQDTVVQKEGRGEPFALFEEYMLKDHIPEYPMDPSFQLHFKGLLDWDKVRQTLLTLFSRHLLLQRRAQKRFGRLFWIPADKLPEMERVDYDEQPAILNDTGFVNLRQIDLYREPGLHVCYVESRRKNWSRIVFQFHHAVVDGIGVMQFIDEWLILYSNAISSFSPSLELPALESEAFRERYKIGWGVRAYFRHYFDTWRSTRRFVFHFPRPLVRVPSVKKLGKEKDSPRLLTLRFSSEETTNYIRDAKRHGVTVNDALLADFFLAMDKWLTDVKNDKKDGVLRVMAPINMRTARHRNASISNVVSSVFLDRTRREIGKGKESLLHDVASEMRWVKRTGQRYWFLLLLDFLHKAPGAFISLRTPLCRSTGVLSNLGRVLESSPLKRDAKGRLTLGDVVLERIEGKAPVRYKTSLSAVVLTYAGELCLSVCYDSRLISKEEAQRFNEIFRSYSLVLS